MIATLYARSRSEWLLIVPIIIYLLAATSAQSQTPPILKHAESMDVTYQAVLNELKKEGLSIETASLDAGIKTAIVVSSGYHQKGTHSEIQFTKEGDSVTLVRVTVLEQTRYKALKTEPWSEPKLNTEASVALIAKLKEGLAWKD